MVGGILALMIVSVGMVLLRGDRPVASFAPGSPEAALQAYLAAWEAGDDATAWASFSARVRAGISEADYRTEAPMVRSNSTSPGQSRRAFFDPATVKGDSAQVRVTVEVTTVGGINVDRYRTVTTVSLVRESGTWKIDQELMGLEPWGYSKF